MPVEQFFTEGTEKEYKLAEEGPPADGGRMAAAERQPSKEFRKEINASIEFVPSSCREHKGL